MDNLWITFIDSGGVCAYDDCNDMEYIRTTKIIKTGSSLCIVVPKEFLVFLGLQRGDQVVLRVANNNAFFVQKIPQEMLAQFVPLPQISSLAQGQIE